jgi:hypothetical protein
LKILILIAILLVCLSSASAQVVHQISFDRFTHYTIDDWITYAPGLEVTTIDIGDDYVYFGTRNGGILRYHVFDNFWDYPFTTSSGLRSNHIDYLVYHARDNKLYALTSQGIDVYNKAFNYWEPTGLTEMPPRRRPLQADINDFNRERNYNFPEFYRPANSELPGFFTDLPILFRPPDEILDEHNRIFRLSPDRVVDKWRNLWLGTNGLGPARANLNNMTLNFYPQSLSNITPRDLIFDNDKVWITGLANGPEPVGINVWDLDKDDWRYIEARFNFGLHNDNGNTIIAHTDYIFCGSELGLLKYHKKDQRWNTFTTAHGLESNRVNHLFFFDSMLYVATDQGFNWLHPDYSQINESKDTALDNVPIFRISATDSSLLFATRDGVFEYDPERDEISFFGTQSALLDLYVTALGMHNDTLWLAGHYGIMYQDRLNDRWTSFTQIREYVFGAIHDIAFTKGHVWFASDNGLLKYDKKRDYWYLYTEKDGLADRRVYKVVPDHNDLWLCTQKGLTIFRWNRKGRLE